MIKRTKIIWHAFVLILVLLPAVSGTKASASSFGMVTMLTGTAFYGHSGKPAQDRLETFMKLYDGDTVILEKGAVLQLVVFASGRKENWNGPAVLTIDNEEGCVAADPEKQPGITFMPEVVANEVRRMSHIIDPSKVQKAGASIIRGGEVRQEDLIEPVEPDTGEKREINLAKNTYQALLKESGPSDITPELFLFSVLADFDQYDEMDQLIEVMKDKQPGNPTISQLTEWLAGQR